MGTYCDFEGNNLIDFLIKKKKRKEKGNVNLKSTIFFCVMWGFISSFHTHLR